MEVEWKKSPDFAEFAEAIGVVTRQILAVQTAGGRLYLVVFTNEIPDGEVHEPTDPVFCARLFRDDDRILRQVGDVEQIEWDWEVPNEMLQRHLELMIREDEE